MPEASIAGTSNAPSSPSGSSAPSSPAESSKPIVSPVILGGDIGAYSLARTFHEAYGIKPLVLSQANSHLCHDSSILENRVNPQLDDVDVLMQTLKDVAAEKQGETLMVLACGDWYVRLLVEHRAELEEAGYILPYISEELLNRLVLKDSFYEICEECGVPYPKTAVFDTQAPVDPATFGLTFPVVAKPASSAEYHYAKFPGKKKVFVFDTPEQLDEMLNNLCASSYKGKFLLQEFIPGDDTNMRILTTYSDRTGKMRFASFGQTVLEDPRPQAIGNPMAIISRECDEAVECARRLVEHVGYTGFANYDIKVNPETGKFVFFEINTRLGRSNYYVTAAGDNTVRWIVEDLVEGRDFPDEVQVARGRKSLYTVLPKSILVEHVQDPALRDEVEQLFAEGHAKNPINYPAEKKLVRKLYPYYFEQKQKKSLREFYKAEAARKAAEAAGGMRADGEGAGGATAGEGADGSDKAAKGADAAPKRPASPKGYVTVPGPEASTAPTAGTSPEGGER